jgi:hypothetical protein
MIEVMRLESGCRPDAVGDTHLLINEHQGMSCGLFQVRVLDGRPSCESLKNPKTNIEWAYKIYKEQGLRAWSVTHKW